MELLSIFLAILAAEVGDKTQVATIAAAAKGTHGPILVFAAAASALVVSSGIAVAVGYYGGRWLETVPLKLIAGLIFIGLGVWTILDHFRGG
jgi:putative Ca2+/H+ antiporter (TMEM165/GDT1 family)